MYLFKKAALIAMYIEGDVKENMDVFVQNDLIFETVLGLFLFGIIKLKII